MCWVYLYLWSACFYHVDNGQFSITWFSSYNLWTLRIALLFSGFTQRNIEYRCSFRVLVKKRLLLLRLAFFFFGRAARICRQQAMENPRGKLRKTRAVRRWVNEPLGWNSAEQLEQQLPHTNPRVHNFTNSRIQRIRRDERTENIRNANCLNPLPTRGVQIGEKKENQKAFHGNSESASAQSFHSLRLLLLGGLCVFRWAGISFQLII